MHQTPRLTCCVSPYRYLVDGNAYFFTAVDIARRLDFTNGAKTIVVGVGYPPPYPYIYDLLRRGPDLTPPSQDGHYKPLLNSKGEPLSHLTWGEADQFLDFIQHDVMAFVEGNLFSHLSLAEASPKRALYGHSYGGLFSLNSLYTKPDLFDTIIAVSPTVWWNDSSIVEYQEKKFREQPPTADGGRSPCLILTWGSGEEDFPPREKCPDAFHRGNCDPEEKEMEESMAGLIARLKDSRKLRAIWHWKLQGEEHGTMAVAGLQRSLIQFLLG
jgi:predicted alpha/beta superfamily hydrolase